MFFSLTMNKHVKTIIGATIAALPLAPLVALRAAEPQTTAPISASPATTGGVLGDQKLVAYVDAFNRVDPEPYTNAWPNAKALDFLSANVPRFECPDPDIERTYYFRWWTFRKHLRLTPDGWMFTEFMPKVGWSWEDNAISCAASHHIREARWLRDQQYVRQTIHYWAQKTSTRRGYSSWLPATAWQYCVSVGDFTIGQDLLPQWIDLYSLWEAERFDPQMGLFFQSDNGDGMEGAIGGAGYRPTINAYMHANALAIADFAERSGKPETARTYRAKAASLKENVQKLLWNPEQRFFQVRKAPAPLSLMAARLNQDHAFTQSATISAFNEVEAGFLNQPPPASSWPAKGAPLLKWTRGQEGWIQYDFKEPVTLSTMELFFARTEMRHFEHDFPSEVELLYRADGRWHPVVDARGDLNQYDGWNVLAFAPVKADGFRCVLRTFGFDRKTLPLVGVRELHGYTPWYFELPDDEFIVAWQQVLDPQGFKAAWGLTTAEQRHPGFELVYDRHECLWNGPVWPFASAQTLVAMANVLNGEPQDILTKQNYYDTLQTYARSHQITLPDGNVIPWIDENQHPYTGEWIAKTILEKRLRERPEHQVRKGPPDRGKDYNHSTYCDLVINGLIGLRPRPDNVVEVNPLVPDDTWDYFCLDRVPYHGRLLTILWDKTGERYGKGRGLHVFADGKKIAFSETLTNIKGTL